MGTLSERVGSPAPVESPPTNGTGAAWDIRPVPPENRTLRTFDFAVLWGDLGIGLLVLVAGGLLVPGLGFGVAMVAIVLGSIVGVALLAVAATAGADHGLATMVLFRPVLGVRGSWIPSVLNWVQLVGWTAVELWAMSFVADIVASRTLGHSSRPLWLLVAALLCTGLALWGPVGVTRVWLERFGAWIIGGITLAVTVLLFTSDAVGDALGSTGDGSLTFGPALDLVIAMPVSWLPLVADYSRFSRRPRSAFVGTFWGYLIANVWLYAIGALLILTTGTDPSPGGMALGILAVAGGSLAGFLFLLGLLVGETDEAFADIYSGAVSLKNVFPRVPQPVLIIGISGLATALAAWLTMARYETFLFLVGSVFVPLFGVLVADYFVSRRRRVDVRQLFGHAGPYWFTSGVRWSAILPWLCGFAVYHWILPTGPGWWVDSVSAVPGAPLVDSLSWLNASLPSFAVAFLIALGTTRLSRGPEAPEVYPDRPSDGREVSS